MPLSLLYERSICNTILVKKILKQVNKLETKVEKAKNLIEIIKKK